MLTQTDKTNDIKFQEKDDKEQKLVQLIDKYDMNMLNYLARLYEALNGEKLDFSKVKNAVDALQAFNSKQEFNYLNNLLHPERCKGVKIPSPIPVPSCAFQLHNCVTLSTNSQGNLGILFNPYFLYSNIPADRIFEFPKNAIPQPGVDNVSYGTVNWLSSFYVNNAETLTGHGFDSSWTPINIGQGIPNVYDQYRLVSASIVVKYIGRLDIVSGVIGGAVIFDENPTVGGSATIDSAATTLVPQNIGKYSNFDLAMDSFYHQENLTLEGVRELFFPIDNSFEEYIKNDVSGQFNFLLGEQVGGTKTMACSINQDYYKSGFNYYIYALGAPASSSCFKVDIYCNFECLPNAEFLNYLPLSMNPMGVSSEEKRQANLIIQQKPVMKISETNSIVQATMPSIWEKMKKKFSGALPGIGKLIANGVLSMVPGLKGGLALAGNMISDTSTKIEEDVE